MRYTTGINSGGVSSELHNRYKGSSTWRVLSSGAPANLPDSHYGRQSRPRITPWVSRMTGRQLVLRSRSCLLEAAEKINARHAMTKPEIIGSIRSTYTRVVCMVCEEKGIEYALTETPLR